MDSYFVWNMDPTIVTIQTLLGPRKQLLPGKGVDEKTLKAVARETGGFYRAAEDAEGLRAIYREIDEMETSGIEAPRYLDYQEQFGPWVMAALLCLAAEVGLSCTVFRRLP